MLELLIAFPDPALTLDIILETTSVSDPFLVELLATTRIALVMHDDCEAEFACFWAHHSIRISDTIVAATPVQREIIAAEGLRFQEGGLVELRIDGSAQVQRIERALRGWPVAIKRLTSAERGPLLKLA